MTNPTAPTTAPAGTPEFWILVTPDGESAFGPYTYENLVLACQNELMALEAVDENDTPDVPEGDEALMALEGADYRIMPLIEDGSLASKVVKS